MKFRATLLLLTVGATGQAPAAPDHGSIFPPYLTVDMFVAEYGGLPHPSVPGSGSSYVLHHAQGYLAGVIDVGQNRSWCYPTGTMEANAGKWALGELEKKSSKVTERRLNLPPSSAGKILYEHLAEKFPTGGKCLFTPHLTGDEFIRQLTGQIGDSSTPSSGQNSDATNKQRYAEGYLAGVIDSTQGVSWCAPRKLKPMEVESRMLTELDKRMAADPLPDNAAQLLLTLFNEKFPCPQNRLMPGVYENGHIDLVAPQAGGAKKCASD